jgi:rubredoxin
VSKLARVRAYACGVCERVYRKDKEAAECCTCNTCGTKFDSARASLCCGHCDYGMILREARAAVRRTTEQLSRATARLAHLLEMKRPPKGSESP